MAKQKILIVEDDEFLRSLTAKRLEKEGYDLAIAADGDSAVTTAEKEKPDLILLDLLLPGTNGFQALEKMRAIDGLGKTPVVVFSNLGQKEDIEKAKGLGANDFLIKANFTLDDVVAKVKSYLPQ
ncbi:MAG: response regulator [Candidatus Vogelbacteria bacterium]|jgi:CheY-like chemotaxis protein|nr:response regulator [Candidatus Vogelbacteria bacterium]